MTRHSGRARPTEGSKLETELRTELLALQSEHEHLVRTHQKLKAAAPRREGDLLQAARAELAAVKEQLAEALERCGGAEASARKLEEKLRCKTLAWEGLRDANLRLRSQLASECAMTKALGAAGQTQTCKIEELGSSVEALEATLKRREKTLEARNKMVEARDAKIAGHVVELEVLQARSSELTSLKCSIAAQKPRPRKETAASLSAPFKQTASMQDLFYDLLQRVSATDLAICIEGGPRGDLTDQLMGTASFWKRKIDFGKMLTALHEAAWGPAFWVSMMGKFLLSQRDSDELRYAFSHAYSLTTPRKRIFLANPHSPWDPAQRIFFSQPVPPRSLWHPVMLAESKRIELIVLKPESATSPSATS